MNKLMKTLYLNSENFEDYSFEKSKNVVEVLQKIISYYSSDIYYDKSVIVVDQKNLSKYEFILKHKLDSSKSVIYEVSTSLERSGVCIRTDENWKYLVGILHNLKNSKVNELDIYLWYQEASDDDREIEEKVKIAFHAQDQNSLLELFDTL